MTAATANGKVPETLFAALAAFQASLPKIAKGETGKVEGLNKQGKPFSYTYKYAGLDVVSAEALPRLGAVGLAFIALPTTRDDGKFGLAYSLVHVSGGREDGFYELHVNGLTPQQVGGLITYARRYCLCAATGIAPAGDDNDAAEAEAATRRSAGDVFENAAPGRQRQAGGGQATQPDRKAERMDAVPADDPWYTQPAEFAETGQAWIDAALERAVSFTTPAAMRALIAEGREKLKKGEITEGDAARVAELTKAHADELKAAKAKASAAAAPAQIPDLDPDDPWALKVEEITSMDEAEAARAELLAAFKAGQVDTTRANRVQAAIAARLAALEGKVIEGTVAA